MDITITTVKTFKVRNCGECPYVDKDPKEGGACTYGKFMRVNYDTIHKDCPVKKLSR